MRRFNDLPEEDRTVLIGVLIEEGMIDEEGNVTPLGEEYISAGDTEPLDFINTDSIEPLGGN